MNFLNLFLDLELPRRDLSIGTKFLTLTSREVSLRLILRVCLLFVSFIIKIRALSFFFKFYEKLYTHITTTTFFTKFFVFQIFLMPTFLSDLPFFQSFFNHPTRVGVIHFFLYYPVYKMTKIMSVCKNCKNCVLFVSSNKL